MTTPHKATPEQWKQLQACTAIYPGAWGDCILELRDSLLAAEQRIQMLEGSAPIDEAENDRRFRACLAAIDNATPEQIRAAVSNASARLDPQAPAPAGGLVERVRDIIGLHPVADGKARAVILAVAEWLESGGVSPGVRSASYLREVVKHHD